MKNLIEKNKQWTVVLAVFAMFNLLSACSSNQTQVNNSDDDELAQALPGSFDDPSYETDVVPTAPPSDMLGTAEFDDIGDAAALDSATTTQAPETLEPLDKLEDPSFTDSSFDSPADTSFSDTSMNDAAFAQTAAPLLDPVPAVAPLATDEPVLELAFHHPKKTEKVKSAHKTVKKVKKAAVAEVTPVPPVMNEAAPADPSFADPSFAEAPTIAEAPTFDDIPAPAEPVAMAAHESAPLAETPPPAVAPASIAPEHAAINQAGSVVDEEPEPLHKNPYVLGGAFALLVVGGYLAFRPKAD